MHRLLPLPILFLALVGARAQSGPAAADRYHDALDRCRYFLDHARTQEAERACGEAVALAAKLPPDRGRDRITAYELAARIYLDRGMPEDAMEMIAPELTLAAALPLANPQRGEALYQAARAHEGLAEPGAAAENYRAAIRSFEAGWAHSSTSGQKRDCSRLLRAALQDYAQLLAAEGDAREAHAVSLRLAALPAPEPDAHGQAPK